MFLLDGNVFYAQVKFDRHTNTVTLVKGQQLMMHTMKLQKRAH